MSNIMIVGADGPVEARYHAPASRNAPIVIIAPPHPKHDGTMAHKIIYLLFRVFASLNFGVLRFNFRGCGRSPGSFSGGENEISDAAACLDWLLDNNKMASQCWVAGYSFGAWIGMQLLMRRPECVRFISISPPANIYDFGFLAPCPVSGLILHGECDDMIPKESVLRLAYNLSIQRRKNAIEFHMIKGADHSFSEHMKELEDFVFRYSKESLHSLDDAYSDVV
ncbi:alpha/beta hydrolase [Candidatus Hydrogenosomobacter endosymbioticus]|uniref:Alpha/beta hydrolase n=1 Tax=Candidatus Hydrogenosomobacter endosymbioticus TaxID=2558174 RepID=A0ABM7V9M9_9PROT|nr:alpha/beta fold hydrolase [Candidatus Hydrogenosomobacter endosymbioticus]BDB96507.1 alpha/beta hydrolase [Candidatus Hydrogenosomobacter endosymbioticus]